MVSEPKPKFKWSDDCPEAMLDQAVCGCGWKSKPYYDGQEWAYREWQRRVAEKHPESRVTPPTRSTLTHGDGT